MTTTTPRTLLLTFFANIPYNRAQARRRRREIERRDRVCRESVEAGKRAGEAAESEGRI